jgi:hypothetical protein
LSVFPEAAFGLLGRWPPDFSYILSILPEPRWQLFFVILVANLCIIALAVTRGKFAFLAPGLVKIAFATLLFMSSTIHIPEIFRVATGYIIGVISLYVVLKHYKLDNYAFVAFVVLLLFFSTPLSGIRSAFVIIPRKPQLVETPDFFKGQRWPRKYIQYYQNIDADLKILKNAQCGIEFHYNDTVDSFLQLLSPFIQYQIAPFPFDGNLSEVNTLRPDLDLSKKIEAASDIILFQYISPERFASYKPPEGFFVYRKYYPKPRTWNDFTYSYKDLMLIILAPNSCLERLQ